MAKPLLWLATLGVAALAFLPSYGVKLVGRPAAAAPISSPTLQTAELKITGMDCPVCSGVIQRKLLKTPGVVKADVRYPAGSATVQFNSLQTDTSKLIAIVKDTGYTAVVSNSAQQ
jgi:copper chaperone CopZ